MQSQRCILSLVTIIFLMSVRSLASCSVSVPQTACLAGDRACQDAEYAVRQTEHLLQKAYDDPTGAEPFELIGKGNGCWQLFQEKAQQDHPYRLNILMNAQDTPYPFRDVMDVVVEIDFAGQESAVVSWYAGGIGSCLVYTAD